MTDNELKIIESDPKLKELYSKYLKCKMEMEIKQMEYQIKGIKESMLNEDRREKKFAMEPF